MWQFFFKSGWEIALMNATAVLIITCPCALALAVPIVQTIAISNFIRKGILVKSGEALEKLYKTDIVVFDKTGSLTIGAPRLLDIFLLGNGSALEILKQVQHLSSPHRHPELVSGSISSDQKSTYLKLAASIAQKSRHPISQAIAASYQGDLEDLQVQEHQGLGLEATFQNKVLKLGRRSFCGVKNHFESDKNLLTCFAKFGEDELVFLFEDALKEDAEIVVADLKKSGKKIILLSGDHEKTVRDVAKKLAIEEFYFEQTPILKVNFLEKLRLENKKFIMVGDGLNDAPALALAHISISFSKASDISQNVADIVIQGRKLMPIIDLINSSTKAISLMKQNLLIALVYNLVAVPYAISGNVVPLIAAIAMSSSSLLVLFNSLRMNRS